MSDFSWEFWLILLIFGACIAYMVYRVRVYLHNIGDTSVNGFKRWLKEYAFPKSSRKYWLLILAFVPAVWWSGLWERRTILSWWQSCYGKIPDATFFHWEEYIALNSHNNEFPAQIGFYLIAAVIILWLIWDLKKIRMSSGALSLLIILLVIDLLWMMPCLCRAREYGRRVRCQSDLKYIGLKLQAYADENGCFPEELKADIDELNPNRNTEYIYSGAGKKPSKQLFILIEDIPRAHAGDWRHRYWSDGNIDHYYPWKTKEGAK